jgi:hypothetical protein
MCLCDLSRPVKKLSEHGLREGFNRCEGYRLKTAVGGGGRTWDGEVLPAVMGFLGETLAVKVENVGERDGK